MEIHLVVFGQGRKRKSVTSNKNTSLLANHCTYLGEYITSLLILHKRIKKLGHVHTISYYYIYFKLINRYYHLTFNYFFIVLPKQRSDPLFDYIISTNSTSW
jgi:hypothetical protein